MRPLIAFLGISLDGFHADADGQLGWQTLGDEFVAYSLEQLAEVDALMLGRTTFDGMVQYWPQRVGQDFNDEIAHQMNSIKKYVVSRSLHAADWDNTRIIRDVAGVEAVKAEDGKGVAIFGSSSLTVELIRRGVLDELRLMVNPIVLGAGARLLDGLDQTGFQLLRTRPFAAGHVLLTYSPQSRSRW